MGRPILLFAPASEASQIIDEEGFALLVRAALA
jgi:hypothetical protein